MVALDSLDKAFRVSASLSFIMQCHQHEVGCLKSRDVCLHMSCSVGAVMLIPNPSHLIPMPRTTDLATFMRLLGRSMPV